MPKTKNSTPTSEWEAQDKCPSCGVPCNIFTDLDDKDYCNDCRPVVQVVHCKKERYDVYIGRPSKWGNPFTHKEGTRADFILPTRFEAIEAYGKWITEGDGRHLLKDLHELKGKILGCWCKPQSCHGDILKDLVNKL